MIEPNNFYIDYRVASDKRAKRKVNKREFDKHIDRMKIANVPVTIIKENKKWTLVSV